MGQITATRNLVAIKVVRHAGQSHWGHWWRRLHWIGQRQLQDETKKFKFGDLVHLILEILQYWFKITNASLKGQWVKCHSHHRSSPAEFKARLKEVEEQQRQAREDAVKQVQELEKKIVGDKTLTKKKVMAHQQVYTKQTKLTIPLVDSQNLL